jgi:hypothetical protein
VYYSPQSHRWWGFAVLVPRAGLQSRSMIKARSSSGGAIPGLLCFLAAVIRVVIGWSPAGVRE